MKLLYSLLAVACLAIMFVSHRDSVLEMIDVQFDVHDGAIFISRDHDLICIF